MRIKVLIVNDLQTNCYILEDEDTKEAVILDPGGEADYIIDEIEKNNFNLKAILLTHGHFDHIEAVLAIKEKYNIPVYAHEAEQTILKSSQANISSMFGEDAVTMSADKTFVDGDIFTFGNTSLKVIHTPGHTPGGVSYYYQKDNVLFSGDTLFLLSVGRTDFPYGDYKALISSIKDKLFLLPDNTKVFTGHGDSTTIGKEKKLNPCLSDMWE